MEEKDLLIYCYNSHFNLELCLTVFDKILFIFLQNFQELQNSFGMVNQPNLSFFDR